MVRLKLPLLSGEAWGSFAKALTFAKNKTKSYVKKYQAYAYSRSAGQNTMRKRFVICKIVWADLPSAGKEAWARFPTLGPICKDNALMKLNLKTSFPAREVPELPGVAYNRKSEWIVGLARIGETPMGEKTLYRHRWQ